MNVFVAGASGAIGQPLIAELIRQGHKVAGLTHSEAGAQRLIDLGAAVAFVDALDGPAVEAAVRRFHTEIIIDELTALPRDPADYAAAFEGDRKLRLEGGGNLLRAAQACGVRRYLQQASGFFLKGGGGLADESASLAIDASPGVAASAQSYAHLEARLLHTSGSVEGVVLRYGFFYGPNTWYSPEGAAADHVRRRETPIVGRGEAIWSFIHIDDATIATVTAMTVPPGVYNIVDDDPSPVSRWLPGFARWVGAPPPPHLSEQQVPERAGEEAVYYGTKLSGASNHKAKKAFDFRPRRLQWLDL